MSQTRTPLAEPFYIVKWATLLGFVALEFLNVRLLQHDHKQVLKLEGPIITVLFLIEYIFLTSFHSISVFESIFKLFSFILMVFIAFYIIPLYAYSEENRARVIQALFMFIISVLTVNLFYTVFFPGRAFSSHLYVRYLGITENPNTLGIICFVGLPVLIYKFQTGTKKVKFISAIYAALAIIFVIMSFSRASMLAVAVIMGFVFYFYNRFLLKLGLVLAVIIVIVLILNPALLELLRLAENPFSYRDQLVEIGLRAWNDHLFLGTGYNTAHIVTGEKFLYAQKGYDLYLVGKHFHNIYLEVLVEDGLIGIILFITMIISWTISGFRAIRKWADLRRTFAICYTGLLLAVILQGFFESFLLSAGNSASIMFWVLTGLTVQKLKIQSNDIPAEIVDGKS